MLHVVIFFLCQPPLLFLYVGRHCSVAWEKADGMKDKYGFVYIALVFCVFSFLSSLSGFFCLSVLFFSLVRFNMRTR
ncbi:hypothetical protein L209DRAFT_237059 [Thermothelomyces heterothallicus CBS 203.75]